jgi:endonuclease/exonuclease/phosphatase family metal-dependent hydrolase
MNFSIVTFNIFKDDGDFPNRIFEIHKYLKDIDIICFQEDYNSNNFSSSDEINKNLKLHKMTLPLREKERNGILSSSNITILSKFKMKMIKNFIFNFGNDERGSLIVEVETSGKKVIIINTHLTNLNQKDRIHQIERLFENIDYDIVIFCGDMNFNPDSKEYEMIKNLGFETKNSKATYEDGTILDYIFYKSNFSFEVWSEIIVKDLSDHYCLKNMFALKEN